MTPAFLDSAALLVFGTTLAGGVGVMGWMVRAVLALQREVARLAVLVENRNRLEGAP